MLFRNWYWLYANQTPAEEAMERALLARGIRYRAQHLFPGLRHVADFALLDDKVIIEVDGKSHLEPGQIIKDLVHTIALVKLGWKVARCTNEECLRFADEALNKCLVERLNHLPTLAELEAKLQALDPDGVLRRPKRTRRKRGPRQRAAPRKPSRKAKAESKG